MERKNAWLKYQEDEKKAVFDFSEGYRKYISVCKTERECVTETIAQIEKEGYLNLEEVISSGRKLLAGDKVYANNMGKSLVMFHIGTEPIEAGMNIVGAHIDSPRLDLKQNPLYEDADLALLCPPAGRLLFSSGSLI